MTVPLTQQHVEKFVERNHFLLALLGLVASTRRAERWLSAVPPGSEREGQRASGTFVDFLLGVVSVGKTLEHQVQSFVRESSEELPSRAAKEAPCLRSLLK